MLKVHIKRIDKTIPLPEYKTSGAVAFDLSARVGMTILPHEIARVPLNVIIEPPEGYMVLLCSRSSLHKKGLMPANGVGVMDRDFSGNDDEYQAVLFNFTNNPVSIEKGERIMQATFQKYDRVEWEEVEEMENKTRGGFGTTGRV